MNLDKQEELSPSTDSAVALSLSADLEGQLERPMSKINHLNSYLTQSVSRFGEQSQNQGNRLANLENSLMSVEVQSSGRESENTIEAQETKSEVSTAGDAIGVESETDSLLCSMPREEEEDKSVVTRNLLAKLSPELKNALAVDNCDTIFQLASLYELKALSDAAQDMCKILKE